MAEHRCSRCWSAQYQIKSDVPCPNEWRALYEAVEAAGGYR
jgi:hypothetical protein